LCNATLTYVRQLASLGVDGFAAVDAGRAAALNIREGRIVHKVVSQVFPDLPK
jgi:alanine dehydrogenase